MEGRKPSIRREKPTIKNIYVPRCRGKNPVETDTGECNMHSLVSTEEKCILRS